MNKPEFPRTTNVVTLRCNLNCRLCAICSPYYQKPWHPTLDYVNKVTDKLFEIADYKIFDLTGGEPLIRPDLPEILSHMVSYKKQVSCRFGFQSNGSIPVNDDLVYACKMFGTKFKVIMDDYGPELSPYAQENYQILRSHNIPVELRHQYADSQYCDGWVDYIGNGSIEHSDAEAELIFSKCAQPQIMNFCAVAVEGKVFPCPVMYSLEQIYHRIPEPHEYIDLFDNSESISEKRTKWSELYSLRKLTACKNCNGICSDSKRYMPAEQLSKTSVSRYKGDK